MIPDREFYFRAEEFLRGQTPTTLIITPLPIGCGYTNFRSPAIYVAIPSSDSEDHTDSVCALFHEYGHWLDMRLWLTANNIKGDARDSAMKYNEYLEEIGACEKPGRRLDKVVMLKNERDAWNYGKNGVTIGSRLHKGLKDFDDSIGDRTGWLLGKFDECSKKMIKTYEEMTV